MVERDVVLKEKVKFVGYAKFSDLYSYAYDWVKGESYTIIEDTYTEKVKGNAKDLEIVWKASKEITDYFKIELDFKWRIFGMEDVEVEIDGKKKENEQVCRVRY